ncbi:MAG TPA: glycoside hydrolase family 3 N-terminal domain-containing protein [Anaerolineales bacterium]|nr:glycoside hydrolase family 3 N-terminal domain-containing protein [Anaerolineales bacterium]
MWFYVLSLVLLLIAGGIFFLLSIRPTLETRRNLALLGTEAPRRMQDGITFRDLNKNGRLDPYEDPRCPVEERLEDLLGQMTLEEKAGLMFQTMIAMNKDGTIFEKTGLFPIPQTSDMIARRLMNHFNLLYGSDPRHMAEWHNRIQKMAEQTRLGIPVTISTDPRHAFTQNPLTSLGGGGFSRFPEPTGLAATRDVDLVRQFADIARQEYLAVGIRLALHPMADLATEPRWARCNGTFGEDADLAAQMTAAYIHGFQGASLGKESVACMTKHFPGGGPQKDGEDAHFPYGREQVYPGDNFDYHLKPFESAFAAGTAQIMPYYGMPLDTPLEEVGFGFNKDVINGLLRGTYGFDGVVCTDWTLLTSSFKILGWDMMPARAWGVEQLSVEERALKALEAGVDQFGGEACPEVIVQLVREGRVSEERLDQSVRRLLRDKFRLGLFDDPYVDVEAAEKIVGKPEFRQAGELTQRKSIVLLKNTKQTLPLKRRLKIYVENIKPEAIRPYGQAVKSVREADLAILRLSAPYEKRKGMMERWFHAGDLDFKEPEKTRILNILQQVPTIVDIYLERPAVIPEIAEKSMALLANFGASDEAVLDVIFGQFEPQGKLPFELPSSMDAVRRQKEDLPHDSEDPLFPFGYGLRY